MKSDKFSKLLSALGKSDHESESYKIFSSVTKRLMAVVKDSEAKNKDFVVFVSCLDDGSVETIELASAARRLSVLTEDGNVFWVYSKVDGGGGFGPIDRPTGQLEKVTKAFLGDDEYLIKNG